METISPIRRAGLIGDVHAEPERLEAAVNWLKTLSLDCILCTGDIMTGPGDVNRCVQLLDEVDAVVVRGNHDRWTLDGQKLMHTRATDPASVDDRTWSYLRSLPAIREVETCRGPALLCHGLGDNDMASLRLGDYGYALESNTALVAITALHYFVYVIAGHTHQRMAREVEGTIFINAGTLRADNDPVFAYVDFEEGFVQFYSIHNLDGVETLERVSIQ